ncbi:MAG: hypothetical protein K0V04_23795 [Deltaproteobacteria bacterium]|nr:hypothetical protein [Deltaproteobacteria bacterium]
MTRAIRKLAGGTAARLAAYSLGLTLCSLGVAACGGEDDGRGSSGPGIGSVSQSGTGTTAGSGGNSTQGSGPTPGTGTGSSGPGADSDTGSPIPNFDLGLQPDIFVEPQDGCTKVDFLFTIDNSGSMAGDQANLVANFPAFINGIQQALQTVDEYQVGVVTTDTYGPNIGGCNALSSLVVNTGGSNSSNTQCGPYADGFNFMTEADDLATSFTCAAQVGTSGSGAERQMQATVEAVQRVQGGVGQCNEAYLDEDSLLIIVIITDESDSDSNGNPQQWFDDVVAARSGIEENVVVVSLINPGDNSCGSDTADGISAFTGMFTNGFEAPVCIADYGPAFQQAIDLIEDACNNFVPPG